jgi:hypothetical protein
MRDQEGGDTEPLIGYQEPLAGYQEPLGGYQVHKSKMIIKADA